MDRALDFNATDPDSKHGVATLPEPTIPLRYAKINMIARE